MNTQKVVRLFWRTLLLGGIAGLLTSFFVNPGIYAENMNPFNGMELIGLVLFYLGFGLLASVVSQTGFFAYLFIHRFGLGLFRSFWPTVQVLLIAFILFDLVYFPYNASEGEVSIIWFIVMTAGLFIISWIVAKIKAKETNKTAFIPALFFMVVITTVEWVPALRAEGSDYAWLMIVPLLICNAYQLITLHRLQKA
ncbi:KinB-signaling pathway activation protein [Ornithinibacillus halophilus]|uniref:KinB signaling pathway activation protein n=1 Tax=Ornithinibacillus halophilus TaxID=930117 RepID=A0A1M5H515_9BACI|nr:KinB-signaling pathway activation protein [Ornithinibacillus halophilus]SHG11099.1 KinB signaling pathway activation protein [Ornithinibacillus halophilus]